MTLVARIAPVCPVVIAMVVPFGLGIAETERGSPPSVAWRSDLQRRRAAIDFGA
jgi:hypothetical protein